ncbi:MAG: Mov34/MPN/PAD-1 family protein [Acidimicrobiales bacterium]|nr:Mov34/MPN/PAD-1 family protein [Acidimicrobiales bacterium]
MKAEPRTIDMTDTAWAEVAQCAGADPRRETGGILLGWRHPGGIHVERVLEIPDRQAGHTWYRRRHAPAEAALTAALDQLPEDCDLGYVGEWHSHPAPVGPSFCDRHELRRISGKTAREVALLVAALDPGMSTWVPFGLTAYRRRMREAVVDIAAQGQDAKVDS